MLTTEQRLRRLERQNRLLMAGLVMLVGALLIGATGKEAVPDVVKARAFHVVGKNGTVLVKIKSSLPSGRGPGTVTTRNSRGQELVTLNATSEDEGMIRTLNGKGQELVLISSNTVGREGMVSTWNGKGQRLVRLGVGTNGVGMVTTLNGKGDELVMLGARTDGPGSVTTYDPRSIEARAVWTTRP